MIKNLLPTKQYGRINAGGLKISEFQDKYHQRLENLDEEEILASFRDNLTLFGNNEMLLSSILQFIQNCAQYNPVKTNSPSRPSPIAGSLISSRLITNLINYQLNPSLFI